MQNRGAIKAIAIILAIACAYQLSFTFVARNIEKKAARYAEGFPVELQQERQQSYLDSIKSQKVFLGFTYKQVKEREINLGLDLTVRTPSSMRRFRRHGASRRTVRKILLHSSRVHTPTFQAMLRWRSSSIPRSCAKRLLPPARTNRSSVY